MEGSGTKFTVAENYPETFDELHDLGKWIAVRRARIVDAPPTRRAVV